MKRSLKAQIWYLLQPDWAGTGTGAIVIAKSPATLGADHRCCHKAFFEGMARMRIAEDGWALLREKVDALILFK